MSRTGRNTRTRKRATVQRRETAVANALHRISVAGLIVKRESPPLQLADRQWLTARATDDLSTSVPVTPVRQSPRLTKKSVARGGNSAYPSPPLTEQRSGQLSLAAADQKLPTLPQALVRKPFKRYTGSHHWTLEQMETLCVLKLCFSLSTKELVMLLNAQCPDSISPFTPSMCSTRIAHLRHGPYRHAVSGTLVEAHRVWKFLSRAPAQLPVKYRMLIHALVEMARKIGVTVTLRSEVEEHPRQRHRRGMKRRPVLQATSALTLVKTGISPNITVAAPAPHLIIKAETPQLPSLYTFPESSFSSSTTSDPIITPSTSRFAIEVRITRPLRTHSSYSLPCPALLFRSYTHKSAGLNTPTGFKAGFYAAVPSIRDTAIGSPEKSTSMTFLVDALNHLAGAHTGTRFISVSRSLVWVFHKAIRATSTKSTTTALTSTKSTSRKSTATKSARKPPSQNSAASLSKVTKRPPKTKTLTQSRSSEPPTISHIAIFNGPEVDTATGVYPVAPIVKELTKREWWPPTRVDNARYTKYKAVHEYFVWGKIAAHSIIRDFSLPYILEFAARNTDVKRLLRLAVFKSSRCVLSLRWEFFENPVVLDHSIGKALGQLLVWFGIGPDADEESICMMLYALIQGWVVHIPADAAARKESFDAFLSAFTGQPSTGSWTALLSSKVNRAFENAVWCAHEDLQAERSGLQYRKPRRSER